jgi:hypothetical protein
MNATWKNRALVGCLAVLVVALVVALTWQPALGQKEGGTAGYPRYTVVETEGHNLIVTDNQKSTLYFYTIDKDSKIGSDLKLRGQVDLKQVGNKVIKPANVHLRKED